MTCTFWNHGCTLSEGVLDFRGEPEVGHPEECRYFVPQGGEVVVTVRISQSPPPPSPKLTRYDIFEQVVYYYPRDTDSTRASVYSWLSGVIFSMGESSDLAQYCSSLRTLVHSLEREDFLTYARNHVKS
jgi:hypothetical protein